MRKLYAYEKPCRELGRQYQIDWRISSKWTKQKNLGETSKERAKVTDVRNFSKRVNDRQGKQPDKEARSRENCCLNPYCLECG